MVKWLFSVAVIAGFALLPYSMFSVGAALVCILALFTLFRFQTGPQKAHPPLAPIARNPCPSPHRLRNKHARVLSLLSRHLLLVCVTRNPCPSLPSPSHQTCESPPFPRDRRAPNHAIQPCPKPPAHQTCVGPAFSLGTSSRSQCHEGKGGASGRPAYLQRPTSARTRSPRTPRDRPQACRSRAVPDRAGALRTARPSRPRQPAERRTA